MFQLLLVAGLFSIAGFITPAHAQDISLIDTNAFWKYLDAGVDLGTAWRTLNFDDRAWASGPRPLGYGGTWLNTVLNIGSGTNRLLAAYFRRTFVVPDTGAITGLTSRLLRDDGGMVYLNGAEVLRHNMPAGAVNYWTLATTAVGGADETTYFTNSIPPSLLLNGTNVLDRSFALPHLSP
jgi:hypothetical protein